MKAGYTKQIAVIFKYDHEGNIIDGKKEGDKDSRFVGTTYFNDMGEKSTDGGLSAVRVVSFNNMTDMEKDDFLDTVANHELSIELAKGNS